MDIDIDTKSSFMVTTVLPTAVPASMVKDGELVKHPCGHYFQNIPIDPVTGLAAIPYEESEVLGYFKVDFLHLSILDNFNNKDEIRSLIATEPDWTILQDRNNVEKLFQLRRHYDLLAIVKPVCVNDLADCVALIRPNKRDLLSLYLRDKKTARKQIYRTDKDDKSAFRRSHALAYSLTIVLQLHLISQGRL